MSKPKCLRSGIKYTVTRPVNTNNACDIKVGNNTLEGRVLSVNLENEGNDMKVNCYMPYNEISTAELMNNFNGEAIKTLTQALNIPTNDGDLYDHYTKHYCEDVKSDQGGGVCQLSPTRDPDVIQNTHSTKKWLAFAVVLMMIIGLWLIWRRR